MNAKKLLYPVAFIYRIIIFFRNKFFDWGIFKEKEYPVPIICVGNVTVGGTAKTPHIEYLVELLHPTYKVAVLSRGYKRKTQGFVLAEAGCDASVIGDESFQLFLKYPDILVAVDEKRRRGVEALLSLDESRRPEIILLDDAFQHRYVKPGISLLLMNYNNMPYEDALLPVGRLREPLAAKRRAAVVLVTKCDDNVKPIDLLLIKKELNLFPYQSIFFTKFEYADLQPVFKNVNINSIALEDLREYTVLLITGIASSEHLQHDLMNMNASIYAHLKYKDHYWYTKHDFEKITTTFDKIEVAKKIILTTEKDAVKMQTHDLPMEIKEKMFYLPVRVCFLNGEERDFNKLVLDYVITDKRNSIFS